jgi:hypothetical protein
MLRLSAEPKRWISVTAPVAPVAPVARVSRAFLKTCAAARAETPPLAAERDQLLGPTALATHAQKAVLEAPALQRIIVVTAGGQDDPAAVAAGGEGEDRECPGHY